MASSSLAPAYLMLGVQALLPIVLGSFKSLKVGADLWTRLMDCELTSIMSDTSLDGDLAQAEIERVSSSSDRRR